ncbi:HAD hydrolase-like protein, partial [Candidatus Pelagibacter sp.]|nr:HAD hydrolase-like protein [Candidatus Pelagibacter sp.]
NNNNFLVIVVTNQACVGKLIITENKLKIIHKFMINKIKQKKGRIDDIFYSTYFKKSKTSKFRIGLYDRKPNPGMLIKGINKWNINIKKSYFIGDSLSDFKASKKINLKFFYKTKESLLKQVKNIIC